MCRAKLDLICQRIKESTADYLVYMDGDITVERNFEEDIKMALTDVNLVFQCDEHEPTECDPAGCKSACTGFIAIRLKGTDKAHLLRLFDVGQQPDVWRKVKGLDQDFVNLNLQETRLFWSTLPRQLYPNGVYFNRNLYDTDAAFIIHFNWMVGNEKRQRMKRAGKWILPIHF